jgi:hypothetical protein
MTNSHTKSLAVALVFSAACSAGDEMRTSYGGLGGLDGGDPHDTSGGADIGDSDFDSNADDGGGKSSSDDGDSGATEGGALKWDLGGAESGGTEDGGAGAGDCPTPALMIVLDRSFSMAQAPDGSGWAADVQSTKWAAAVGAVETFVANFDESIELGFAMFPSPADNDYCDKVIDVITDADVDEMLCDAEVALNPAPGIGPKISNRIDPEETRLCKGTPVERALDVAGSAFGQSVGAPNIVLVTDGKESCDGDPVGRAQELAADGVLTWVVGFGNIPLGSQSHEALNELACAGRTAANLVADCVDDGFGNLSALDANGAALYLVAEDGVALADTLSEGIAGNLCCGTACPPG